MKNVWEEARELLTKIAVVGILAGNKILTGKRRDNELWTFPGGHVDDGESLLEGAVREVNEEAGIEIGTEELELVTAERVTSHRAVGKEFSVFCFLARISREKADARNDPDKEITEWKWVEIDERTPELQAEVRHAKKDSLLHYIGVLK